MIQGVNALPTTEAELHRMLENVTPSPLVTGGQPAPRRYRSMRAHTFGAACDIICKLVIWTIILDDSDGIYSSDVQDREACKCFSVMGKGAIDKIRQVHLDLGHDNALQWSIKGRCGILAKHGAVLGKRLAVIRGVFKGHGAAVYTAAAGTATSATECHGY
ncbi:hypothetical protein E8E12_008933 [Didymella heteroderae]|uniref:Uncharacterized protein n=1 Tax=Didymella heteroderae TaxID=1769908 RepID=A0A9P4WYY6_9PLEO|nr:hypothetical protein E8E12_008933 [Didymella heteroderae]